MPIWMTSDGTTPVSLTVRDAPPRTVSGGLQYSTDTGFGVRGAWENRNLFGGGEQLRVIRIYRLTVLREIRREELILRILIPDW